MTSALVIHVTVDEGGVDVWLDTTDEENTAIRIGHGRTRADALESAAAELDALIVEIAALREERT